MALQAQLQAEVDTGGFAASLDATLTTGSADLTAISLPDAPNETDNAATALAALDLSALEGPIAGLVSEIGALAGEIAKADMAPYFDTASDAIGTAADVVDAVPFALLPDDMEQDVVDAIRPIKQTDVQGEINGFKTTLGLSDEGLALTKELEDGLAEIQAKIDALIAFVRDDLDPAQAFEHLDPTMADLREAIAKIHQGIDLSGLRQMFEDAKSQVTGLDAAALLAPTATA